MNSLNIIKKDGQGRAIRILSILPGKPPSLHMAEAQILLTRKEGVDNRIFYTGKPLNFSRAVLRLRDLFKTVWSFDPDIIHAQYGTFAAFLGFLVFWKKLVITFRGSDLNIDQNVPRWRAMLGHFLSQISNLRAEKTFCVSEQLSKKIWFRKKNLSILPTGLNFDLFYPIDAKECRSLLNLPLNSKIIGFYSGKNRALKRKDLALAVFDGVKKAIPDCQFLELDGNIPHKLIPVFLNAVDCVILTSEQEGSPNIVKESLACKTPVIVFNVGDVKKWVDRDPLSKIIEDRNINDMIEKVLGVLNSQVKKDRDIDLLELDTNRIVGRVVDAYEEICIDRHPKKLPTEEIVFLP